MEESAKGMLNCRFSEEGDIFEMQHKQLSEIRVFCVSVPDPFFEPY